ncbi:hypothetical protein PMAYCL1PPCAC_06491, partial [Pristionchus mayeri]
RMIAVNNLYGTIWNYVEKLKQYTYPDTQKTQPSGIPPAVAVPSSSSAPSPGSQQYQTVPPSPGSQQYQTVPETKDDGVKKAQAARPPPPEDDGQYINCAEMSPEELKKHLSK